MTAASSASSASSIAFLYRSIWRYALGKRLQLLASMTLLVASQLVKLAAPVMTARAIDSLQQGGDAAVWRAGMWVGAVMLVYVGAWALHGPGRVLERSVGVQVRQRLSDSLYAKLGRAPLPWHEQHHSGDLQHRVAQSSAALSGFAQSQFVYVQSVVSFIGPLVALTLLSPRIGGLAAVGYVLVSLVIVRFDAVLMRLAVEENHAERRYASGLLDFLGNIATVASLRLQDSTRRLLAHRLDAVFRPLKRLIVLNEVKWGAVDILSVGLTWGLVAVFVWQSRSNGGTLLIGTLFMIYQYAQQASTVIASMASNFQTIARTRTDVASANPIWEAPEREPADVFAASWQRIDIDGLSYSREPTLPESVAGRDQGRAADLAGEDAATPRRGHLDKVTLSLRRGERIALVGPSGSGKSTLMRVLAGLYEPQAARIEIDGVPQPSMRHLGSISTLIPQEADVFESTVRENIAFDLPVDDSAIEDAARISAFDEVLRSLPAGLDTPISERGFNMSGGQRQRLCLARGVLAAHDSSLVMLDEPTSALDSTTEALVFERLFAHFPQACMVASVHRMSLLGHFDRVVLLVAGRVADTGTPAAVASRNALFADMLHGTQPAPSKPGRASGSEPAT